VVSSLYVTEAIVSILNGSWSWVRKAVVGSFDQFGKTTQAIKLWRCCNFVMLMESWMREFA